VTAADALQVLGEVFGIVALIGVSAGIGYLLKLDGPR